ncbi:MAG: NifB/NifX family molybdenum-iron cluster-binding protein [Sedimentisphaerales bacterium]|jgi:predicted Fe-Mo cluster-binding NifX family protein|nr:NifB/NifX family molybdenum-iron cluster-binding protein [Sedimentisphaerales bacterium]
MKIAVIATGPTLDSRLDDRFGRTRHIIIYDLQSQTFQAMDNRPSLDSAQGAGIQTAEAVISAGAQAVITRHCGPKAFRVLNAAGVKVFMSQATTVADAIESFKRGDLQEAQTEDVPGHWS